MYGVPTDLDLSVFQGAKLTQLRILAGGMVYFEFDDLAPQGEIGVEGRWLIQAADGRRVESTREGEVIESPAGDLRGGAALLLRVVGRVVTAWRVEPPTSFTLVLDDGSTLTVFDDSDRLESFCIYPLGVFV
jgi:hypothetical protein